MSKLVSTFRTIELVAIPRQIFIVVVEKVAYFVV